jgi:hypothetical protein
VGHPRHCAVVGADAMLSMMTVLSRIDIEEPHILLGPKL